MIARTAGISRLWGPPEFTRGVLPDSARPILLAILVSTFILRLAVAWLLPNIQHADEVYQVAEQANRAVNGYGIVPWEFRNAARTVLLTTLVKPIYALNASVATHQLLVASLFTALSLVPVWVAFHWAGRLFGLRGGIVAAVMMATWFELVYFAPKPTADAVGGYLLLLGLFLARPAARPAAVLLAGLSLILALAIRIQIAPAVGLALILAGVMGGLTRTAALLVGVAAGLVLTGTIEWLWWGVPFQGQRGYLMMEWLHGASTFFGGEPLTFFVKAYVLMYGLALPIIGFLIYSGGKKAPVLLLVAVAVILPFHFIGHKEYRFVVAGLPLLVLLMGLAAADLMSRVDLTARPLVAPALFAGWLVSMVAVSLGDQVPTILDARRQSHSSVSRGRSTA